MRTSLLITLLLFAASCQRGIPHRGERLDVDWQAMRQSCGNAAGEVRALGWTVILLPEAGDGWVVELRFAPDGPAERAHFVEVARLRAGASPEPARRAAYPADQVAVTRERVQFAEAVLERHADGRRFTLQVSFDDAAGVSRSLQAELTRRSPPWLPGPTMLPTSTGAGTCIELVALAPLADLSGSIIVGDRRERLFGTAYLDRVAWLTAEGRTFRAWQRAVAHADGQVALIFRPLQRAARSHVYLGDTDGCRLCATDAPLAVATPSPVASLLDASYVHLGRVMRLRAKLPAFPEDRVQGTALSRGILDVTTHRGRDRFDGPAVVDLKLWRAR